MINIISVGDVFLDTSLSQIEYPVLVEVRCFGRGRVTFFYCDTQECAYHINNEDIEWCKNNYLFDATTLIRVLYGS